MSMVSESVVCTLSRLEASVTSSICLQSLNLWFVPCTLSLFEALLACAMWLALSRALKLPLEGTCGLHSLSSIEALGLYLSVVSIPPPQVVVQTLMHRRLLCRLHVACTLSCGLKLCLQGSLVSELQLLLLLRSIDVPVEL